MKLWQHIGNFAVTFVALFPVVNPVGCAPIFLALTKSYPQSVRKVLAGKVALYGFMLLVASFLAMGATAVVAAPAIAGDKKAEMKCDAKGKACKKGADCKAENCKAEKK